MQDVEDYNREAMAQNPDLIGSTFMSNTYGKFRVIRQVGTVHHEHGNKPLYEIEFETGYKTTTRRGNIMYGSIKDYKYPSVCKIGYLETSTQKTRDDIYNLLTTNSEYSELCKRNSIIVSRDIIDKMVCTKDRPSQLYVSWRNMIGRCYDPKNDHYYFYGAKGVTVSDRWHSYRRYAEDCIIKLIHIKNGLNRFLNGEFNLDKDKLQADMPKDNTIYSNETTVYLTHHENSILAHKHRMYPFKMIDAYTGLCRIETNINQCAKDNNINESCIINCLSGKHSQAGHYMFENLSESEMKDFDNDKIKIGDVFTVDVSGYRNYKLFMYKHENGNRWVIASGQSATGQKLKIDCRYISHCLNGGRKTSCGYQFKYLTDEEIDLISKNILCIGDTIVIDDFGNKHYYAGDYEIDIEWSKSIQLTGDRCGGIIMRRSQ